jgi:hypothetical protein
MNSLESFWDHAHLGKNKGSLSGCSLDETIDFLQIKLQQTEEKFLILKKHQYLNL